MRSIPAATAVLQYLQNKLRACCISQPYTALCLEAAHAQIIPAKLHCWYNTGLQGAAGSCKELLGGTGCCWELLVGMVDLGVPGISERSRGSQYCQLCPAGKLCQMVKSSGTGFSFPPKLDKLESSELVRGKIKPRARSSKGKPFLWLPVWTQYRCDALWYQVALEAQGCYRIPRWDPCSPTGPCCTHLPAGSGSKAKADICWTYWEETVIEKYVLQFPCSLFYLSPACVQKNQFFCISALTPADVESGHHSSARHLAAPRVRLALPMCSQTSPTCRY